MSSSYFEDKIKELTMVHYTHYFNEEISFRTEEGIEEAFNQSYRENMLQCYVLTVDGYEEMFYVSRAYNPNHVFVYIEDHSNNKFYLENLSTNVSIVHERYNFGSVETWENELYLIIDR